MTHPQGGDVPGCGQGRQGQDRQQRGAGPGVPDPGGPGQDGQEGRHKAAQAYDHPVGDRLGVGHALVTQGLRGQEDGGVADQAHRVGQHRQPHQGQADQQPAGALPAGPGVQGAGAGQVHGADVVHDDVVQVQHVEVAVGLNTVAPAVPVVVGGEEVRPHLGGGLLAGPHDVVDHVVALNVDVRVDLVGDLAGQGAQAHRAVVGGAPEPVHDAPPGQDPPGRGVPEAHMVALGGVALHLLLVGEVLTPPEQGERGDRGRRVGAACQGGDDDPPGGGGRDGVGARPAGARHGLVDVVLVPQDGQVDRVPQDAVGGAGAADEVVGHVQPGEDLVEAGDGQVGQEHPEQDECQDGPGGHVPARTDDGPRQPHGGQGGHGEEDGVHDVVQAPGAGARLGELVVVRAVGGCRGGARPGRHRVTHVATVAGSPPRGGTLPASCGRRRAASGPGRGRPCGRTAG